MRSFNRKALDLRPVTITPGASMHAEGSAQIEFGNTKVLVTCSVEEKVPPHVFGSGGGLVGSEAELVASELRRLIDEAHAAAGKILAGARPVLDTIVECLLEKETLTAAQLAALVSPEGSPLASADVLW